MNDDLPLSFGQQRIWLVEQMAPGNVAYVNHDVNVLRGRLDVAALGRAVQRVVDRHDGLRSRIPATTAGREPRQWFAAHAAQPLVVVDCASPQDDGLAALQPVVQEFLRSHAGIPFDLAAENPLRSYLLRWTDELHALVLVAHHIAVDGWSLTTIVEEVSHFYGRELGVSGGEPLAAAVQYSDVVRWERAAFDRTRVDQELEFWRAYLEGAPDQIVLPWDSTLGENRTKSGQMLNLLLPEDVAHGVRHLAAANRCTMYMVLAAAVSVVLARYSGQPDVVLGTPVAGRLRPELESVVGLFTNLVAVRVGVEDHLTFADMLRRTRASSLKALAHQELSFDEVLRGLNVPRVRGRTPLFQVSLSVNNLPDRPLSLHGLVVAHVQAELEGARYDLSATFVPEAEGLRLRLQYDTTRFLEATIETFVSHLVQVVRHVSASPDILVGDIDLATQEEKDRVRSFSATTEPAGRQAPCPDVVERFAGLAQDGPDRLVALRGDERWTRRELAEEVSRVSRSLAGAAIGPADVVAVRMPRGLPFLATVLAIWRRGAVFLPVDLRHPARRVAFMLDDADARLVVTTTDVEPLPVRLGQRVVTYEALVDVDQPGDDVPAPVDGQAIAYVMYTSGSTGNPKGVAVRRSSLAVFCQDVAVLVGMSPLDVSVSLTTASFDISLLEYLAPVLAGGAVRFVEQDATDVRAVRAALDAQPPVSLLGGTPTVWQSLRVAGADVPDGVRLMLGGEPMPPVLVEHLQARRLPYWNFYGPTEATVYCTALARRGAEPEPAPAEVTRCIGSPFGRNRVHVLDEARRPCPVNVPGEIVVAGPQVAAGYLGSPELTTSRFPLDRIAEDGSRSYRTGDAARWDALGRLVFLGRLDTQVKVRGFRVELEEIEVRLRECPGVSAAVVGVDPDDADRLVAGVVPDGADAPQPSALRAHLAQTLPPYMIPSAFQTLAALPMTVPGKLDRSALSGARTTVPGSGVAASPQEQAVCSIFQDVLGRDDVGRDTHFFVVGGHSLLAVQVVLRLSDIVDCPLEVADVFRFPTPRELAHRLGRPVLLDEPALALRRGGEDLTVLCLPDLTGTPWPFLHLLGHVPQEISVFAARSRLLADEGRRAPLADVVDEFLDAVDAVAAPGQLVLLGSSVGASLAPYVAAGAASAGSRVSGMVLLDPVPVQDPGLDGRPHDVECDVLHVHADGTEPAPADPARTATAGRLREVTVRAAHAQMLAPQHVAEYGPVVRQELLRLAGDA